MSKHTPGPWTYSARTLEGKPLGDHAVMANGYCVAVVDRNEANARLIAAAPQMLQALLECSLLFDEGAEPPSKKELSHAAGSVRAAIIAAESR